MRNTVLWFDNWLGQVLMHELDCVGVQVVLGVSINNVETPVVFEGGSDVKILSSSIFRCLVTFWAGMDHYRTVEGGSKRCGIKVKFPCICFVR